MIFLGFIIGGDVITGFVNMIPEVIKLGLAQSGNLLPALGVAMLIQLTFDKKFGAFLFLGFALVAFLNISTIGAAFIGVIAAYVYYQLAGNNRSNTPLASEESEEL
ncbi:MAG: PTS sugar transporter subunit IIC [Anaerorhabdus sp.]|uniref:PTS sugar transporter subunit IIC n=1 Tax=Anaerorhabdus sp. TaxID=1872524 RepID=UPI003A885901